MVEVIKRGEYSTEVRPMDNALARGWWSGLAYSEVRSLHRDPFPATGALHEVAWPANSIDHMGVLADKTLPGAVLDGF